VLGKSASLRVEGFTDSQGADAANLSLSRQRAEAVRKALVGAGLDGGRIQTVGRGKAEPVADNASAEGRARNRRVEIIVQ
jgi:outer membrane protein OmpA-like peptidoglycan-associated protein